MSTCHGPHDEERHGRYRDAWEVEGDVRRRDCSTNSMESFLFNDEGGSDDGGGGAHGGDHDCHHGNDFSSITIKWW